MGNNTWVLADLPPGGKPLSCKWIFKRKLKVDGTIEKFKARLVIQGFKQKSRIDYFDTYVLVARISTIRLLIGMTSIHNLDIHQMDVKTAFLNGDLDEECSKVTLMQAGSATLRTIRLQILLGGGAISWASKKQTYITGSIMDSECVALAVAGMEVEWLKNLLIEIPLWSKPIAPISIRYDSVAILAKAYSQMYNGKSRHLGVRHSMIRELIMNGTPNSLLRKLGSWVQCGKLNVQRTEARVFTYHPKDVLRKPVE
ncbi:zinc finger, CCHC-type containing protein [Tanacetum coccineum]